MVDAPVVERRTKDMSANRWTMDNGTWKAYPTPEGNKEAEPSKRKHTTIHVEGVEAGD